MASLFIYKIVIHFPMSNQGYISFMSQQNKNIILYQDREFHCLSVIFKKLDHMLERPGCENSSCGWVPDLVVNSNQAGLIKLNRIQKFKDPNFLTLKFDLWLSWYLLDVQPALTCCQKSSFNCFNKVIFRGHEPTGPKGVINDWRRFKLDTVDQMVPQSKRELLRQMSAPREDDKERLNRKVNDHNISNISKVLILQLNVGRSQLYRYVDTD